MAKQKGPRGFEMSDEPEADGGLPEMSFPALVLSLSASAMTHLGVALEPDSEPPTPNRPLAKQTIDILAMLEEKTRGNLDEAEAQLLANVLHDLRLKFVEIESG